MTYNNLQLSTDAIFMQQDETVSIDNITVNWNSSDKLLSINENKEGYFLRIEYNTQIVSLLNHLYSNITFNLK